MPTKRLVGLVLVGALLLPASVSAHVLVPDTTGTSGAVLHFSPDDSVRAGVGTYFHYDVRSKTKVHNDNVMLRIQDAAGGINELVPVKVNGNDVAANFAFPLRGIYFLTLTVLSTSETEKTVNFAYTLRIEHSVLANDPSPTIPLWVLAGLVISTWLCVFSVFKAIKLPRPRKK